MYICFHSYTVLLPITLSKGPVQGRQREPGERQVDEKYTLDRSSLNFIPFFFNLLEQKYFPLSAISVAFPLTLHSNWTVSAAVTARKYSSRHWPSCPYLVSWHPSFCSSKKGHPWAAAWLQSSVDLGDPGQFELTGNSNEAGEGEAPSNPWPSFWMLMEVEPELSLDA
jgi:hypothetical protein